MSMDEISSGRLFVGDLEAANNAALLRKFKITALLSIGCTVGPTITGLFPEPRRLAYPDPIDLPETLLGAIWSSTNAWLRRQQAAGEVVLVHCRYGQSRSVAVAAAHLLCTGQHTGASADFAERLDQMLQFLACKRPSLCINPGFLAQLHMVAVLGRCSLDCPEVRLMHFTETGSLLLQQQKQLSSEGEEGPAACSHKRRRGVESADYCDARAGMVGARASMVCRRCRTVLANAEDALGSTYASYAAALGAFIDVQLSKDPFWKGYAADGKGAGKGEGKGGDKGGGKGRGKGEQGSKQGSAEATDDAVVCMAPPEWMQQQAMQGGAECELRCPGCAHVCGAWTRRGLCIGHGYLRVDRFALSSRDIG